MFDEEEDARTLTADHITPLGRSGSRAGHAAVRDFKADGYDFIKLTTEITPEVYDAVTAEARASGIRVVGHVDVRVGLRRALAAGQQIEHLDSYMEAVLRTDAPSKASVSDVGVWRKRNWESLDYKDDRKVEEVARATAAAGVYTCPTLTFFKQTFAVEPSEEEVRARPDYRYFPQRLRESRHAALKRFWTEPPTAERRSCSCSTTSRCTVSCAIWSKRA